MISQKSADTALSMVNQLGINVIPRNGTPIALAMSHMMSIDLNVASGSITDIAKGVVSAAKPNITGQNGHTTVVHETANAAVSSLEHSIRYVRSVIAPTIEEIIASIEEAQQRIDAQSPLNKDLVQVSLPEAYTSSALATMVKIFSETSGGKGELSVDLTNKLIEGLGRDDLLAIMLTNSETLNAQVVELVDRMVEDSGLSMVLELCTKARTNELINDRDYLTNHSSLLSFLFLRGVTHGKHPSYNGSALTPEMNTNVARLMASCGQNILRTISLHNSRITSGRFIIPSEDASAICVHNDMVRVFATNGGDIEHIIAAHALRSTQPKLLDEVNNINASYDKERLTNALNSVRTSSANKSQLIGANAIRKITNDTLTTKINELPLAERVAKHRQLKDVQESWDFIDPADIYSYVRFVTAETLDNGTDALVLMQYVDMLQRIDPEIPATEAAIKATSIQLARWVSSQLAITDTSIGDVARTETSI